MNLDVVAMKSTTVLNSVQLELSLLPDTVQVLGSLADTSFAVAQL